MKDGVEGLAQTSANHHPDVDEKINKPFQSEIEKAVLRATRGILGAALLIAYHNLSHAKPNSQCDAWNC